jgi:uncharacterized protein with HEPN domain
METINAPSDFERDDQSRLLFDGICMMFITIGENLKRIDKILGTEFLLAHPEIEWKKIKGMRDRISHDYFGLDFGATFHAARDGVPDLLRTCSRILIKVTDETDLTK